MDQLAGDPCGSWRALRATPDLLREIRESKESGFRLQEALRKRYAPELVRLALQLHELRQRAKPKFALAAEMWFERTLLEQATSEIVAAHKAQRFSTLDDDVFDLCCGLGADAIALTKVGRTVTAVDTSAISLLLTEWNSEVHCEVQGIAERVRTLQRDVRDLDLSGKAVHIDPDRRSTEQRAVRLEGYEPPLEFLQQLTTTARCGAIKLSPASNFGGKFPDCEIELVSLHGECKEATVWFGELAGENDWRATLLPAGATLTGNPWTAVSSQSSLQRYIYDPDPAVVRAGLIDVLSEQSCLSRLDPAEEYLTSDELSDSPFAQPFEVVEALPSNERELKAWFRGRDCGELEIKCRHIPVSADKLRRKLPLAGTDKLTLLVARVDGKGRAVIARRVTRGLQSRR